MKRLDPARDFTTLTDRNQVFMGERMKRGSAQILYNVYRDSTIKPICPSTF